MRMIGLILLALVAGLAVLALFWPREPVDTEIAFDPGTVGDDIDAYLAGREAEFDDLTPGAEKRVVWAGSPGEATDEVVVYIHGFSATSEEIRPVPDLVAGGLGANLLFWRLAGHGRTGAAMAEPEAGDWIEDIAEALAVADRLGGCVTVIATSTGGTLAAIAALHPELAASVDRIVFVSPNFEVVHPAARFLTWPAARLWVPLVAGAERGFEPFNDRHARFWTTRYPTVSALPMAALVAYARGRDYADATTPALFLFSDDDQVVSAAATRAVAGTWGGPAVMSPQTVEPGDDPMSHVIAGDILSPSMTAPVAASILEWITAN